MNTVKLSVNTQNMVSTLKKAFANYSSVIKELAQNSRRAGASEVRFTIDRSAGVLSVSDNGRGINDMSALLTIASSGWEPSVIEAECAYGMGFLSAIYTAGQLDVTSRDKKLSASTDNILAFDCIDIETVRMTQVTTVTLSGGKVPLLIESICSKLDDEFMWYFEKTFRGFPIRVFINEEEVIRDRSLDSGKKWVCLPDATIYLSTSTVKSMHNFDKLYVEDEWVAYYQGLEISRCFGRRRGMGGEINVIHLDSQKWEAVAPDRHMLVNADDAQERIVSLLAYVAKQYLRHFAAQPENEDIVLNSFHEFARFGLLEIYNRMDRLPLSVVWAQQYYPVRSENDDNPCLLNRLISRAELECRETFIFEDEPQYDDDSCFRYPMYLYAMRESVFWLSEKMHPEHWVYHYCLNAFDENGLDLIEVEIQGIRESGVSDEHSALSLSPVMVECYVLRGPAGDVTVLDHAMVVKGRFLADGVPGKDEVVFIPANSNEYKTILQVNSYYWDDQFQEEAYNRDSDRYLNWLVLEKVGFQPEKLLQRILMQHGSRFHQLVDKQFLVTFAETGSGKVSVDVCM